VPEILFTGMPKQVRRAAAKINEKNYKQRPLSFKGQVQLQVFKM
jgi:hypothetical protein